MNHLINKKYYLKCTVLSPVHVGSGQEKEWVRGGDFIEDNRKIYILDTKKLAANIDNIQLLSDFLINQDEEGLKRKISGNIEDIALMTFENPAYSRNPIKTFIKSGLTNAPFIPGSSIKGSIRSILLKHLITENQRRLTLSGKLETEVFGSSTNGDELMRFFKVSDVPFENTILVNTKVFNLNGSPKQLTGGWKFKGGKFGQTDPHFKKTGFNTIYETLNPFDEGLFTISLAEKPMNLFLKYSHQSIDVKKQEVISGNISEHLFAIINAHTKAYIRKEISFFNKYQADKTDKIVKHLEAINKQIPEDNLSCVLKISAGSGFHSITGDWQFNDYSINNIREKGHRGLLNGDESAKSRKVAILNQDFFLMGFVKLTLISDEELYRLETIREEKRLIEIKEKQLRENEEKLRIEKIENEKKAKEEERINAEQERIAEEQRIQRELEERKQAIIERVEQEKEEAALRREQQIKAGLVFLEKVKDFDGAKSRIDQWMKKASANKIDADQNEYLFEAIKRFYQEAPRREQKKWEMPYEESHNWSKIASWVGEETSLMWYNELIKS